MACAQLVSDVKSLFYTCVEQKMPIMSVVHDNCVGCIYNKPSQRHHELCLSTPLKDILDQYLPEMLDVTPRAQVMNVFIEKIVENQISCENVLDFFKCCDPFSKLKHDSKLQNEFKDFLLSHRDASENGGDVVCKWLYN